MFLKQKTPKTLQNKNKNVQGVLKNVFFGNHSHDSSSIFDDFDIFMSKIIISDLLEKKIGLVHSRHCRQLKICNFMHVNTNIF